MMIPDMIIVMGSTFQVVKETSDEWVGNTNMLTQVIRVNEDLTYEAQYEFLFHEICEIILAKMNALSEGGDRQKCIMLNHCPDEYDDPFMFYTTTLWDTLKRNNLLKEVVESGESEEDEDSKESKCC
jgi:hypothetical protein